MKNIIYIFLNTDEIIDIIKPISPKIKYIGGIKLQQDNQIDPITDVCFYYFLF